MSEDELKAIERRGQMTRDELRAWLDRPLPRGFWRVGYVGPALLKRRSWRDWFDSDEYIGDRSARTGPDETVCEAKACSCEVCSRGRAERVDPIDLLADDA